MGRADGGREGRKSEGLMLAVLATGPPATGSPSIAGHRCEKNTTSDSHREGPPLLEGFAVCVDSSARISV